MSEETSEKPSHFIRDMILADLAAGKAGSCIQTRFPPEPNGYLTLGHAKAICLNFGLAREFGGKCNLRFDDTNPEKEEEEYVLSMKRDISWLGFKWDLECYASDYFEQLYEWAIQLIRQGDAYICELSQEEIKEFRGSLHVPGRESPYRNRPLEESLDLFTRMRAGEFPEGRMVLRARIDMAHPNVNLRDPVMYRIKYTPHHRVGTKWCIYPSYDYTHGQSDSIEKVTHSLCSLEFESHRPLYDWFIEKLGIFPSRQTEFARLNLTYTIMSKRYLRQLVEMKIVSGWDDPRMPTLSGLRRRGVPPEAIRNFMETIGLTKFNSWSDIALFEHAIREVLNRTAIRRMAVLDPVKLTLTNLPEGFLHECELGNNPESPEAGVRKVPFTRELYIEREDFMIDPPKKFFRLKPAGEVRLRGSFIVRCTGYQTDAAGKVTEIQAEADLSTMGANPSDGRKVKGVIHWVSATRGIAVEARVFERLFAVEKPGASDTPFLQELSTDSLKTLKGFAEPELIRACPGDPIQFERVGYFSPDPESTPQRLIFNRTVSLKDSSKT